MNHIKHPNYGDIYVFDANDGISNVVLQRRIWEDALCAKMADYYKPGTDMLDIGANLGLNSIRMHQIKPVTGTIHLFEPQADVFLMMSHNTKNLPRKLYNFPLSNKNEILQFEQVYENVGATSMKSDGNGINVNATMLDSIVFQQPISFVKMDVEGAELQVLDGAKQFFKKI